MRDIEGHCRTQRLLWPDLLDDYVTEDNPVRFIDASVESLDLASLGFARAQAAFTGRPAYDPRDVLKLSIYGDLNRIRSSRRLARETHRHVEIIWLLRKLRPDFKTIADCRKNNTQALQALFRALVRLCRQLDLLGAELLASDGRKFKAVNNKHKHFTQAKLEKALKAIDEPVEQYVRDLDRSEREESRVQQPTSEELQEQRERLKKRQTRYRGFVQESKASGEPQLSLTDPESRSMPKSPAVDVGDNVPSAVDSKPKLMVEQDVTNAVTDDDQLSPMAMSAKETLGVERMSAVADMGSYHGHAIKACAEASVATDVPTPSTSANTKHGRFGKARCTDDPEQDCYRCPAGAELTFRLATTEGKRRVCPEGLEYGSAPSSHAPHSTTGRYPWDTGPRYTPLAWTLG
jgi:transposase